MARFVKMREANGFTLWLNPDDVVMVCEAADGCECYVYCAHAHPSDEPLTFSAPAADIVCALGEGCSTFEAMSYGGTD